MIARQRAMFAYEVDISDYIHLGSPNDVLDYGLYIALYDEGTTRVVGVSHDQTDGNKESAIVEDYVITPNEVKMLYDWFVNHGYYDQEPVRQ